MCPKCSRGAITRFGPYPTDRIFRWLFACQGLDKGCKWWTESNNPFQYTTIRIIGLEAEKPSNAPKRTLEQIHAEWRKEAGLDHLPFSKAIEAEEEKILTAI